MGDGSHFSTAGACLAPVDTHMEPGISPAIDGLAERGPASHRFLRAAWYDAFVPGPAATLVARRVDGSVIAAIPTVPVGPAILGTRAVPGGYWPFRSVALCPYASSSELATLFQGVPSGGTMPRVLRIGPLYADDPALLRLERAAHAAGWATLHHVAGRTFVLDLAALNASGTFPSKSGRRRIAGYERQLAEIAPVRTVRVSGREWTRRIMNDLAAIETNSWVGQSTDGTGAKFMSPDRRDAWFRALRDPVIADALHATILMVGDRPIAFSFDLICGDLQYAIASSFDRRYARYRPGRIVTAAQLAHASASGVRTIDLGAGDSGYKRELGASAGPAIIDCLFVRKRSTAAMLRLKWERGMAKEAEPTPGIACRESATRPAHALERLLMVGLATAAAASAFVE